MHDPRYDSVKKAGRGGLDDMRCPQLAVLICRLTLLLDYYRPWDVALLLNVYSISDTHQTLDCRKFPYNGSFLALVGRDEGLSN